MNEATGELLADANEIVREQLALAWREHIERVSGVLEAQWPERMERVIEETIAGLAARLDGEYRDAFEVQRQQAARSSDAARRELIGKLNRIARRLRSSEDQRQWSNTLVDATRGFCGRAALFLIHGRKLYLETTRNFDDASLAADVSLDDAPAFATAVETRDTLVAMRSASELSQPIAAYVDGDDSGQQDPKCYLFPVVTREHITAVLYADSPEVDVDALELLAAMAGALHKSEPVGPAPMAPDALPDGLVSIFIPPKTAGARAFHLRAQLFARAQMTEITLYQFEKVKNGRTAHDLYTSLKEEIDSAREAFRREFLNASDSMVDYLHLELVRTLANDDAELLGRDYPGPMV